MALTKQQPKAKVSKASPQKLRIDRVKKQMQTKQAAAVVVSSRAASGEAWNIKAPQALLQEDVEAQVRSVYGKISESDLKRITESLWDRFEFDTPYARSYGQERLGVPGRFTVLREWTWPERFDVLERCHQVWERNPLARAGIAWTTSFVVGDGGSLTYFAKEVREVLEEFINDPMNHFKSYEREFCEALQVDGDLFIRFFDNRQGHTVVIPVRPWHIHWLTTDPENYKQVLSYHYVYAIYHDQPGQSELGTVDVPADEMLHIAINRLPYELRGRPEIFSILPWLKAYRDWLEERARINRRKSIYYFMTMKNSTPAQVAAKAATFRTPPAPGSFIVANDNMDLKSVESNIHAEDAREDGRQIKLMAIAGMRLPEFYFADGANSTLASASAQSLPALRKFADFQDILAEQVWSPIFRRAIQNAIDRGRIVEECDMIDAEGEPVMEEDGTTVRKIKSVDAFDYVYPDVKEKDPKNLAQALEIAMAHEWVSKSTAASRMGFDPDRERKKILAEREEDMRLGANVGVDEFGNPIQAPSGGNGGNSNTQGAEKKAGVVGAPTRLKKKVPFTTSPGGADEDRDLPPSEASPNYDGE